MAADFDTLLNELTQVGAKMAAWAARFDEHFTAMWMRRFNRPRWLSGELDFNKLHQQALEKAGASELSEIYAFLDRLCLAYLQADSTQREQVRGVMAAQTALVAWLGRYVREVAERVQTAQDVDVLRIGLAALSIEDYSYNPHLDAKARYDERHVYDSMARLYLAARRAGINAEPHLQAVAALSSTKASRAAPDSPPMRTHMERFTQTPYFLNVVKKQDSL